MTPYELAQIAYDTEPHIDSKLDDDIALWASSEWGIVHKTRDFILLAEVHPRLIAIHIHLLAGDARKAIQCLLAEAPAAYPDVRRVSWRRFGVPKAHSVERVLRAFRLDDTRS